MEIPDIITDTISSVIEDNGIAKKPEGNILFRIQALVCRITSQLARLSQETQFRSQTMKKEYNKASATQAELTKSIGNWGAGTAISSLAIFLLSQQYPPSFMNGDGAAIQKAAEGVSKMVESLGQGKSSYLQAESAQASSISQLRNTEISNEATKSGEARDLQSELQQILGNIRELYKKASN